MSTLSSIHWNPSYSFFFASLTCLSFPICMVSLRALPQAESNIFIGYPSWKYLLFWKGCPPRPGFGWCECAFVCWGVGRGGEEPSLICMIAVAVPVKLVKYYCLGRVLPDFVYKHWAGCLQGKEVTALSEPWPLKGQRASESSFLLPLLASPLP